MNLINEIVFFVLLITAFATFTIADNVLAKTLRSHFVFYLAVAGLSILGLWTLPNGRIKLILLIYALLASVLVFSLLCSLLLKLLRMLFNFAHQHRNSKGLKPCRKEEESPVAR